MSPVGVGGVEGSPDQVGEGSVQVHRGRGAAEHGQDAFQVQELQLLLVTAEQNQHTDTRTGRQN